MSTPPQPECPICLEAEANLCLPCGGYHWVHRTCWDRVVDKGRCPVCIRPLPISTEEKVERAAPDLMPAVRSMLQGVGVRVNYAPRTGLTASLTFGGHQEEEVKTPPPRRSGRYGNAIEVIQDINTWDQEQGRRLDTSLGVIKRSIINGHQIRRQDLDYINRQHQRVMQEISMKNWG